MVDGSSLWLNPENQFVLRFNDINQERQTKLAQRIKQASRRQKIRNENGPTIEEIVSLLKEINPIIHAEGPNRRENDKWKNWNKTNIQSLSSRYFEELDKLIYRFLCLKRPPYIDEIAAALRFSVRHIQDNSSSYDNTIRTLIATLPPNNEPPENIVLSEIGIEDIQSARERTERRNT